MAIGQDKPSGYDPDIGSYVRSEEQALALTTKSVGASADLKPSLGFVPAYRADHLYSIRATATSHYVSVELGAPIGVYAMLRARATAVSTWERFQMIQFYYTSTGQGSDIYALWSPANQGLVLAQNDFPGNYAGMLRATGNPSDSVIELSERFELVSLGGNDVAFRSLENGKYVSAELGYTGDNYGMLRARATTIGASERFDIRDAGSLPI